MKKAFLKTCALALSLLLATLLFTACGETSGLPSLEDAQKIEVGMTVDEVVDILGPAARETFISNLTTELWWKLDNGSTLKLGIEQSPVGIRPDARILNVCIDPTFSICTTPLRLSDFGYGSGHINWRNFASYSETANLPDNFIYPVALKCFGQSGFTLILDDWNGHSYYQHIVILGQANLYFTVQTGIAQLPYNTTQLPSGATDGQESLLRLNDSDYNDPGILYYRNGLIYVYSSSGALIGIEWVENNTYYSIGIDVTFQTPHKQEETAAALKGLLSLDDAEAMAAWNDLKTYIKEHNPKQTSYTEMVFCTVILVVVVGAIGWVLVRKKRAKNFPAQCIDPEIDPYAGSLEPEVLQEQNGGAAAMPLTSPTPQATDTDLESTAPSPEIADTALESTAPSPETPQNE